MLYCREVEAKQNTELAMRNMQMELRTALANIKQVQKINFLSHKMWGIMLNLFSKRTSVLNSSITTEHHAPEHCMKVYVLYFSWKKKKKI